MSGTQPEDGAGIRVEVTVSAKACMQAMHRCGAQDVEALRETGKQMNLDSQPEPGSEADPELLGPESRCLQQ